MIKSIRKFVIFSDTHIHPLKDEATVLENGRNSRLQESLDVLKEILKVHCDARIFGGDLFHVRKVVDVDAFNNVRDLLVEASQENDLFLVGNHDQYNKSGTINSLQSLSSYLNVVSQPDWCTLYVNTDEVAKSDFFVRVFAIPYHNEASEVISLIEWAIAHKQKDSFNILLLHQGLDGARISASNSYSMKSVLTLGNLEAGEWDLILSGHYHIPQQLASNVYHIGATHQHGWIDANELRGYWVLTVEKHKNGTYAYSMEHHKTSAPEFIKKDVRDIQGKLEVSDKDHLRLISTGNADSVIRDLGLEGKSNVDVQVKTEVEVQENRLGLHVGMSMDDILSTYVKARTEEENVEYFMQVGRELLIPSAEDQ